MEENMFRTHQYLYLIGDRKFTLDANPKRLFFLTVTVLTIARHQHGTGQGSEEKEERMHLANKTLAQNTTSRIRHAMMEARDAGALSTVQL